MFSKDKSLLCTKHFHCFSVHPYKYLSAKYLYIFGLSSCLEVLLNDEESGELHRHCVEQYDHLRDEFERYKLRAQSVLKNKSTASKVHSHLIVI